MNDSLESCPELPAPPRRIAFFSFVALALGIGLACWIERPRGPQCHGILMARTTYIKAQAPGMLAEVDVVEGAVVGINDPLVRIADEELDRQIVQKQREIASLNSELQQALAATELELTWRLRTLESEICDIQLRSASFLKEKYNFELQQSMLSDVLAGQELAMAAEPQSLFQSLVLDDKVNPGNRMATVFEMELAANAAEVSAAQVEICDLRQNQLEVLRDSLPVQIRRTQGVDVAEADLSRAQEELDRLLSQQNQLTVVSPSIGRVGVFHCKPGDQLVPGTPIVELLDDARRYLMVCIPSRDITEFPIETSVKLEFPGKQIRTGRITSIAPQAQPVDTDDLFSGDTVIMAQVDQTGRVWPDVPIGSRVVVRVDR